MRMDEIKQVNKEEPIPADLLRLQDESVQMSESEQKLRKYIRTRLEEHAGIRKPSLNEGKKSETLKKLDTVIDNQFKLFEAVVLKKKDKLDESVDEGLRDMATKFTQGLEGRFKKQKELKSSIEVDPANAKSALYKAYQQEIAYSAGVGTFIKQATPENALEVAQQAANDPNGLGKISQKGGLLIYIPAGV